MYFECAVCYNDVIELSLIGGGGYLPTMLLKVYVPAKPIPSR